MARSTVEDPVSSVDDFDPARLRTIIEAFHRTVDDRQDEIAIRGSDADISWNELRARAEAVASGLVGLGVEHGDAVAILLSNRLEFHVVDIAGMLVGAVPFSIYQTLPPDQIRHLLQDSGTRVVVTEPRFRILVESATEGLDLPIIDVDPTEGATLTLAGVEAAGRASAVDLSDRQERIGPDTLLTLIYTSGTTGPSKGVELTHGNALAAVVATKSRIPFPRDARVISWLPAAHIAERIAHHYLPMAFGVQITSCADPQQIGRYLPEVEPTWFFGVPRIWEKLKAGLEASIAGLEPAARDRVQAAVAAGRRRVKLEQSGESVPADLQSELDEADTAFFAGLREKLGFARLAVANVGSAPVPPDVIEFFHAIGVPLSEIYGMSETFGVGCSNPLERIKIGTVGLPADGVELRLQEDGEIAIRSKAVMRGYRNMPEQTAAALVDGWYLTGDVGKIDEEGYVSIIDRKKEIIINSAGKNMSPAIIESTTKSSNPLIGQVCVIGDARPYNIALVVLDPQVATAWAASHGLEGASIEELAANPDLHAEVHASIDQTNAQLSRPEQIKTFHIVRGDWLPAGDELTPTSKMKRRSIVTKYAAEIEAMYAAGRRP